MKNLFSLRTSKIPGLTSRLIASSILLACMGAAQAEDLVIVVPEGAQKPEALSGQMVEWKAKLGTDNVIWVDSLKREKPSGFASMAVLGFSNDTHRAAWRKAHAGKLNGSLQVSDVDTLVEGGVAPPASSKPVYKISYYKLLSSREAFQAWVDGYLGKYLEAQLEHKILTRYAMYLERGEGGRLLLVLEYPDVETEQGAEPIKEGLSEKIARTDAEYVRQLDLKESLRTTQSWTLAVPAR